MYLCIDYHLSQIHSFCFSVLFHNYLYQTYRTCSIACHLNFCCWIITSTPLPPDICLELYKPGWKVLKNYRIQTKNILYFIHSFWTPKKDIFGCIGSSKLFSDKGNLKIAENWKLQNSFETKVWPFFLTLFIFSIFSIIYRGTMSWMKFWYDKIVFWGF